MAALHAGSMGSRLCAGTTTKLGAPVCSGYFRSRSQTRGWGMEWILKLEVAGGEGPSLDVMEISKPDDLGDIANLGLTLAEAKQLLARARSPARRQANTRAGGRFVPAAKMFVR
jgi:hypothetical protein